MKNLFMWMLSTIVFWLIPVLFIAAMYAGVQGGSISHALRVLTEGSGIVAFIFWFGVAAFLVGFQVWPPKDDPDFAEPKPVFNDLDEVMNQSIIDVARRKPGFGDVVIMADMNMKIKELQARLDAAMKQNVKFVSQLAKYNTETMEDGDVATIVYRFQQKQIQENIWQD